MSPDPQHTTEFVLGQITAKLDDIHQMVHRIDDKYSESIANLMEKDAEQEARITSLITWRARVRGAAAVVIALPAAGFTIIKALGVKLGL